MKSTIGIITCFFGEFPWYFPYFLHSCKFNPTIDFYIITDISWSGELPPNVKFINKTINDINEIATEKLGFKVAINDAYKLCDFKPAYGFLFPALVKGYEFWGYADIDVVYGNIRSFITHELLNSYDIISCRHDYLAGVFCLVRNDPKINKLFMQSKDYKMVYSNPQLYSFCECNFLWKELDEGASIFDFPDHIESMTWVVKKAAELGQIKAHFDFIIAEGTPGKIKWEEGAIIYNNRYEAMLYHLVVFKSKCKHQRVLDPIPETFYFSPSRIYK